MSIPSNLSTCVACRNAALCLEVFCIWGDRSLWHIRQTVPNGNWSSWAQMGEASHSSAPAVVLSQTGWLYIFTRNDSDGLWLKVQKTPGSDETPWTPIDETIAPPVAASDRDGRLEVFGQIPDGQVRYMAQIAVDSKWLGPTSVGGKIVGTPTIGEDLDGRLELFARDSSNRLTHIWQAAVGAHWLPEWKQRGWLLGSDPVCARNADGRLEVFARGDDGALHHIWQTAVSNGWSNPDSRGGQITTKPAVGVNADGRLEVFARGTDNALWHICQESPGGGWAGWDWSGWESLGGDLRTL